MATNSKTKGVAIGKRAKIDKAQSIMLGVVCGASLILGITIVGVIYFVKTISYQGKWVSHITDAAKTYESVQNNLNSVAEGVRALGDNENLESVATKTPDRKTCMDFDVNEKRSFSMYRMVVKAYHLAVLPKVKLRKSLAILSIRLASALHCRIIRQRLEMRLIRLSRRYVTTIYSLP